MEALIGAGAGAFVLILGAIANVWINSRKSKVDNDKTVRNGVLDEWRAVQGQAAGAGDSVLNGVPVFRP